MTDPRELEDRETLRKLFQHRDEMTADTASAVAFVAYTIAREELERADIPLSPYQTQEERGLRPRVTYADPDNEQAVIEPLVGDPLTAYEETLYTDALTTLLATVDRQIVEAAIVRYSEANLLSAEGKKVDRLSKLTNLGVVGALQRERLRSRGLAILDTFERYVSTATNH